MSVDEDDAHIPAGTDESVITEEGEDDVDETGMEDMEDDDELPEEEGVLGMYNAKEVNDQVFEELELDPAMVQEVTSTWNFFMNSAGTREAAGEAIYAAIFDAAPSLQNLFRTPRAVMAMRFMTGLNQIICSLGDPKALKVVVETLAFQHLDLEVTIPRVQIFRDAIIDLLEVEMGDRMTPLAHDGWATFLNYVGGAYIYVRVKFTDRLRILSSSWATANNKTLDDAEHEDGEAQAEEGLQVTGEVVDEAMEVIERPDPKAKEASKKKQSMVGKISAKWWSGKSLKDKDRDKSGSGEKDGETRNASVPTTFPEMFMFNAAVMGFANHTWMNEVLQSFDTIVTHVSNTYRLQEECEVLSLRMAKYRGNINLAEYKAVMLAALRSLVPKDWNSAHEVAWSWLWENVERMLTSLMGKPAKQEKALQKLWGSLDETSQSFVRREVYTKFFSLAPAGQDYFKQSTTRLHFIADKVVAMTLEIYKDPRKMVEDISALGLRHVGYGIPTDLFGPFVTACVQVVRTLTDDHMAEEAFRWSLSLISRILTRVINEGSTIVMKAINSNSGKSLKKAVGCAPRGKRARWVLNVEVGTQSISPLLWAIETGSLDAAKAIIQDLLTIRADRDRYYYGMDQMFERHPDIIRRLCVDAPALLPTLLDGLIWRSRTTENGQRRVNYYVKHLVVDSAGDFSMATEWIIENQDPKLVCHPVVALVTDIVWSKVAFRTFLYGKTWFLFTLTVFICSQSILNRLNDGGGEDLDGDSVISAGEDTTPSSVRVAIFLCRCFIYCCSMGQWIYYHFKHTVGNFREKEFEKVGPIWVPEYLANWQDVASLMLTMLLILMLCMEPVLRCFADNGGKAFTQRCEDGQSLLFPYSVVSAMATLLYFVLLMDLSVFSTRVSAYVLVCGRVLAEVALFLFGLGFFTCAFACAISSLDQEDPAFAGIHLAALHLLKIALGMFSGSGFDALQDEPSLLVSVLLYVIISIVYLLNLLIAQLSCSYQATYQDMLGYARLNRGKIVTETMPSVSKQRWDKFVKSLRLDERVEFGEGDIGLAGGIQVFEPASANITTVDMIRRFGGSTSPAAQWPSDPTDMEEDRFDKLEKMIEKSMKRLSRKHGKFASGTGSLLSSSHNSQGSSGSSSGSLME